MNRPNTPSNSRIQSGKLQSLREELLLNRYNLVEPTGVYPIDNVSTQSTSPPRYPDFQPWRHTSKEDDIAITHLQKGYFETPHVGNELLSARNIIYQLLRSKNSLNELSSNLLKSIDVRSTNNKVGHGLYKPPPRVTLTDQKKEAWLKDLAQNNVPLRKLARTIPHGVRNKVLLEQCISKNIPLSRAIWLVRCVGTNELRGLKRKGGTNIEFNWVQEWTTQVVEYIEKLSLDYLKFETFQQATESWKFKISYILRFASNLYMESLIDKDFFNNWINRFFKNSKVFEIPLALTIVKIFWDEIIKTDLLIKELTETLILRYKQVSSLKDMLESKDINITDPKLNDKIKYEIISELRSLIIESFQISIDNFIIPKNWDQLRPLLKNILELNKEEDIKKFELINYRNESLMINYSLNNSVAVKDLVTTLDNLDNIIDYKALLELVLTERWKSNLETLLKWCITKYRCESYRVPLAVEIFRKLKHQQQVSIKDIESEVLEIVFKLHTETDLIDFKNLFSLLNELSQIKVFKTPIYIRKLISSGLVYLTDNPEEKKLHSQILKNMRPHRSNQATMVLRNLDDEPQIDELPTDEKLKHGLKLLENFQEDDLTTVQFLSGLEVGLKLNISDAYLQSVLSRENLFPLLTYKELKDIIKVFSVLNDSNNLTTFVFKALESGDLDNQQLELIAEIALTYITYLTITFNLEKLVDSILKYHRINVGARLTKFWSTVVKFLTNDEQIAEITDIINDKQIKIDNSSVISKINSLSLSISLEDLLNYEHFHNNFQSLIRFLFSDNLNTNNKKNATDLLLVLKDFNVLEFNKTIFVFIKKTYSNTNELFKFDSLIELIVSDLVNMNLIVETFLSFDSTVHKNFVTDLLFKKFPHSECFDTMKLLLLRSQYKKNNPNVLLNLIKDSVLENDFKIDSIQIDSSDLINSLLPERTKYKTEFLSIFLDNLIHKPELIVSSFVNDKAIPNDKVISLLNEVLLLNGDEDNVKEVPSLLESLTKLNQFDLSIFQILFKLTVGPDVSDDETRSIFEAILGNSCANNKLYGALFELLDPELKGKFVHHLESLFLNSKTFPSVVINEQNIALETISEVLTTLSSNCQDIALKDELIFALDASLGSLVNIVTKADCLSGLLYSAISLFLKIIIIHRSYLVGIIVERNTIKESFLNNIVNLLTTKLVSQNLQLKNLLYDLILSIKSSVNEVNSNQTSHIKLPLSILNLPAISSVDEISKKRGTKHQNLHQFNVTNNFFIYQKTSSTYHDFKMKLFDLLEDSNPIESINDTAISLQLFEASLERKNPSI